jgi:DEAD/DEAH box helicase domain-containing protein
MFGLLYALESMAALLLMCDRRDLGTAIGERPPDARVGADWVTEAPVVEEEGLVDPNVARDYFEPNLYLYDAYPGGIGFSEPLFRAHEILLRRTRELIVSCKCEDGCPSCVGPVGDKAVAMEILRRILE